MIHFVFLMLVALLASPHPAWGDTTSHSIQVGTVKDPNRGIKKTDPGLVISNITFKLKDPGKETVWIQANRFFTPSAFALDEGKPRFVIDIEGTGPLKQGLSLIAARGQCIERIRTYYNRKDRRLRVVLDLQPSKSYQISQFFYQAENIYAVEVKEE